MILLHGTTSFIKHVFIMDSTSTTGSGKTGLTYSGITGYGVRSGSTLATLTLVDITTLGTWDTDVTDNKLGFKKIDDTKVPGMYEVHFPNNLLAAGASGVTVQLRASGAAPCNIEIELVSATRGLTGSALPAAAADAAGGLPISDAGGLDLDAHIGGLTFTTANRLDTNVILIEGVDATSQIGDAVWDEASSGHTDAGKAGAQLWTDIDALVTGDIIRDIIVEDSLTIQQVLAVLLALAAGKVTGGGTSTPSFRNQADTINRLAFTTNASGNRVCVITLSDLP